MTKKEALIAAIAALNTEDDAEAIEVLNKMVEQLSKPRSDEKRKAATASARAELVSKVAPVLRKYLDVDRTAKELFAVAASELPEDFSVAKVQNVLIREMAPELVKTETKGKANTYRLAQ